MVDQSGDQFFPRTALSLQEHGGIAFDDTTDRLVHLLHRQAVAYELLITAPHGSERALVLLSSETARFQRPCGQGTNLVQVKGLGQVIEGPSPHRLDSI